MEPKNIGQQLNEVIAKADEGTLAISAKKKDVVVTLELGDHAYLTAVYYAATPADALPDAVTLSANDQDITLTEDEVRVISRYL